MAYSVQNDVGLIGWLWRISLQRFRPAEYLAAFILQVYALEIIKPVRFCRTHFEDIFTFADVVLSCTVFIPLSGDVRILINKVGIHVDYPVVFDRIELQHFIKCAAAGIRLRVSTAHPKRQRIGCDPVRCQIQFCIIGQRSDGLIIALFFGGFIPLRELV